MKSGSVGTQPVSESGAEAAGNPLLGTWQLKAYVWQVSANGERLNLMGEHPKGYLHYLPDGRMSAILVRDNRVKSADVNPSDDVRVRLHKTMVAYAGSYTLDAGKVTHHVDISWNEAWTGTDQVRFYTVEGDTLTITTAPAQNPSNGREGVSVLVWEKVKGRGE